MLVTRGIHDHPTSGGDLSSRWIMGDVDGDDDGDDDGDGDSRVVPVDWKNRQRSKDVLGSPSCNAEGKLCNVCKVSILVMGNWETGEAVQRG